MIVNITQKELKAMIMLYTEREALLIKTMCYFILFYYLLIMWISVFIT